MDSELTLDAVDRRILAALQLQGRITYDELAAQVQLSASAVLRRVRRLEDAGVIAGYAAIVPPGKLGLGLSAYIEVHLQRSADHWKNPQKFDPDRWADGGVAANPIGSDYFFPFGRGPRMWGR